MKFFISQFLCFLQGRASRRNIRLLLRFLLVLASMVTVYSVLFHFLMALERRDYSWVTGFYWTLTVMSTLGFGDITFYSDLGKVFSMVVLLSGIVFLLMLLPFTFIQFFYAPWMAAQEAARAPRKLPAETRGHVVITHYGPVTTALIQKLTPFQYSYVLLVAELEEALRLHDLGIRVMVGELDLPDTYRRLRIENAAMVVTTASDVANTNVVFTVRELNTSVPIFATARDASSVDILKLAGATYVARLAEDLGQSLARRTIGGDAVAHVIGRFDELLIAEATTAGTPLVGKTLAESRLRELAGVNVVGVWERGRFETAGPATRITANTVLLLAGSQEQIQQYNELFCIYHVAGAPVLIIGGGRVGRAVGQALDQRRMDHRIIEKLPERIRAPEKCVLGDAVQIEVLDRAGFKEAPAVIITPHDDDTNIYLTILCRKLRPDLQIISRATRERNISTLHRAGADFVMSYASMGANMIFNLLQRGDILMVAEGLDVFRVRANETLAGKTVLGLPIRAETGCNVVALRQNGKLSINPDPHLPLNTADEIILIGSVEAEKKFLERFRDAVEGSASKI